MTARSETHERHLNNGCVHIVFSSGRSRQEQEAWYADGVSREDGPFAASSGTAYPSDSYYGIKGVRRLPNYVIAAGCAVLVAFGFVYFFLAYKFVSTLL